MSAKKRKSAPCPHCGRRFASPNGLGVHISRVHTVQDPPPVEEEEQGFNPELPSTRATDLVQGSRRQAYGHPGPIAETAAALWTVWLGSKLQTAISSQDVQMMMALHKVAREKHAPQDDNRTDICGYVNIYEITREWEGYES